MKREINPASAKRPARRMSAGAKALLAASIVVPLVLMVAFPMLNSCVDQLWEPEHWREGPPQPILIYVLEAAVCASFGAVLGGHALGLARHRNMRRARTLAWASFAVAAVAALALAFGVTGIPATGIPWPYETHFQMGTLGVYLTLAIALTVSASRAKRRCEGGRQRA